MLGQLHGGFPEELREVILKDQEPITCRPGELLEPADLEAERAKAAQRIGGYVDDKALVSWLLYPNVFPELVRHRDEYSDTSVIPTPVFLYGLEPGQETSIEIEPGKTLIVRLVTVGKLEKDGTRDLYFELNGEARTITVRDQAAAPDRRPARQGRPGQPEPRRRAHAGQGAQGEREAGRRGEGGRRPHGHRGHEDGDEREGEGGLHGSPR